MMKIQISCPKLGHCALLLLIMAWLVPGAFAQGQLVLKPKVEAGWQSDSNFYKAEDDEKEVYTYNVKPGIEVGYTTGKSTVLLDYSLNVLRYDDQDDLLAGETAAEDFDYVEHNAWFTGQMQVSDRLLIGMDNLYLYTRDSASADIFSNSVDRYKYSLNNFSPRLLYRFGDKFDLGLKYNRLITDYKDDDIGEGEDSAENRGTATLTYNLNTRTAFDLDYQYWCRRYEGDTSDYTSNQVMAEVNHQFNYLTLGVGAGYHGRSFEDDASMDDINAFAWKVSLSGQNPPDTDGIPKHSVYLAASNNFNDSGSGETYYQATRLEARGSYLLLDKINLQLTAWYQMADYEFSDREDDWWYLSAKADYWILDYLAIGLEGGQENRDSNEVGRDFDNQFIMLSLTFDYNLGSK